MNRDEEQCVIAEVLAGRPDRFEALVLAHQRGIYNHCLRMLGNEQDALDASQDAFFRAYRSLSTFRGDSRFSVWLYRLASNVCLDMLRKRPNVPELSLENEDGEAPPVPDTRPSPQVELEKKELRQAVYSALEKLPPEFRETVVLRDVNGLSYDEIGRILHLEPGTVKSRIFRARKKLAAQLLRDGNLSGYVPSEQTGKEGVRDV